MSDCMKMLGILVSNKLSWDQHTDFMSKKASRRPHVFRVLRKHISRKELHHIYASPIRSVFEYCCSVFMKLKRTEPRDFRESTTGPTA